MSYAGGPTVDARLENMRLFRPKNDSLFIKENTLIKLDYNDLFWEDNVNPKTKLSPELLPGDVLIFPGEPRLFFRDNLTLVLAVSSTLISLAILIVSIISVNK